MCIRDSPTGNEPFFHRNGGDAELIPAWLSQSYSKSDGVRSAFAWLHKRAGVPCNAEVKENMAQYLARVQRVIANEKQKLAQKAIEGRGGVQVYC